MAAEFNMSSLLSALEGTKVDTIQMAATLTELKRSLEDRPRSKYHSKYTRKENALKTKIAEIEKELTELRTRMKSRVDRMERARAMAARKGENTMQIDPDDVRDFDGIRTKMSSLRTHLHDLQKNLHEVAEEAALEAKAAAAEARQIRQAETDLARQQKVFNNHYKVDLSHITSMMSKPWRKRGNNNNNGNNGRGSPRRGGATRRRHRQRRVTRRR
jgi:chromosome segregation ATPase